MVTTFSAAGYIQAHAPWDSFSENNSMLTADQPAQSVDRLAQLRLVTSSSFYQQGLGNVWAYASLFDGWSVHDTDGRSIASETFRGRGRSPCRQAPSSCSRW